MRTWFLVAAFVVLASTFVPALIAACGGGGSKAHTDGPPSIDAPMRDALGIDTPGATGDFVMDFPVASNMTAGHTYVSECLSCTRSTIAECTRLSQTSGAVVNGCDVFDESRSTFYGLDIVEGHNFGKGVLLTHGATADSLVIVGDSALLKVSVAMPGNVQDAAQDPTVTQVWAESIIGTGAFDGGVSGDVATDYIVSLGQMLGVAGLDTNFQRVCLSTYDASTGAPAAVGCFGGPGASYSLTGLAATPSNAMIAIFNSSAGEAALLEVDSGLTVQHLVSFTGGAVLNDVKVAADNTAVVVGRASNTTIVSTIFVAKLAADRTVIWQAVFGGTTANSVSIAADGHYIVSGIANNASVLLELDPADGTILNQASSGSGTSGFFGDKLADGRYWWGEFKNADRWWLLTQTGAMHAVCTGTAITLTKTPSTFPLNPTTMFANMTTFTTSTINATVTISGPQTTSTCSSL